MLPMNCQITAENVITPSFDQMCVADSAQPPNTSSPSTSIANNSNGNDPHGMDCMIPLARLPGNNLFFIFSISYRLCVK